MLSSRIETHDVAALDLFGPIDQSLSEGISRTHDPVADLVDGGLAGTDLGGDSGLGQTRTLKDFDGYGGRHGPEYAYRNPTCHAYGNSTRRTATLTLAAMDHDYLSKNLKFLTSQGGKRASDAAEALGMGQPGINKIANGKTGEAGYRTVAKLAAFYDLTIDDLVLRDLEAEGTAPASQAAGLDTARLTLMLECMEGALSDAKRQLDPDRKARILTLLYADPGIGNTREAVQAALRVAFMAMG